jgi:atypical dual specificity phosphatase
MWTWTLNWGEIREDLVIGSCPITVMDLDRIREVRRATALLSLQTNECRARFDIAYEEHQQYARRIGLVLVNAPMRDFDLPDQRQRLPEAVAALTRLLASGHRVYVHCTAGINRAPLTVLGYLTFVETRSATEAMAWIHRGRPEAEPYLDAYQGCWEDLVGHYRDAIRLRAWELSQRNPSHPCDAHWYQAEREVIREVFIGAQPSIQYPQHASQRTPGTHAHDSVRNASVLR